MQAQQYRRTAAPAAAAGNAYAAAAQQPASSLWTATAGAAGSQPKFGGDRAAGVPLPLGTAQDPPSLQQGMAPRLPVARAATAQGPRARVRSRRARARARRWGVRCVCVSCLAWLPSTFVRRRPGAMTKFMGTRTSCVSSPIPSKLVCHLPVVLRHCLTSVFAIAELSSGYQRSAAPAAQTGAGAYGQPRPAAAGGYTGAKPAAGATGYTGLRPAATAGFTGVRPAAAGGFTGARPAAAAGSTTGYQSSFRVSNAALTTIGTRSR